MNKAELIEILTEKLETDRGSATRAVENLVDAIVRAVQKGDSVTITGFGVFERRRRAARVARNPRTGETVRVKPTSVPAFRPGAQFKAIVSGAQKLPAEGPAVKRGAVGGAVRKAAVKKAVAKKAPAKKAAVKKAAVKKVVKKVVKKAPAKKVVKKVAIKKAPAKKVVKKVAVKKVVKKAPAKKAPAKKVVKKVAVKKAVAKKAPAKKAPVRKAAVKKVVKKAPAKRGRR
jgi:DNA-binding protein HU-beta